MHLTMYRTGEQFAPLVAIYFIFYHLFVTLVSPGVVQSPLIPHPRSPSPFPFPFPTLSPMLTGIECVCCVAYYFLHDNLSLQCSAFSKIILQKTRSCFFNHLLEKFSCILRQYKANWNCRFWSANLPCTVLVVISSIVWVL
jgi:hypothetical protein